MTASDAESFFAVHENHARQKDEVSLGGNNMKKKITVIYWKSEKWWLGKIYEHPEIMTQGETQEELFENLKDAYKLMVFEEVPEDYKVREVVL